MLRTILASAAALTGLAVSSAADCPASTTAIPAVLSSVSCAAPGDCVAVGQTDQGKTPLSDYATSEIETGGKWKTAPVPVPGGSSSGPSELSEVSCMSATDCLAIGGYGALHGDGGHSLALRWDGTKWAAIGGASTYSALSCFGSGCVGTGMAVSGQPVAGYWNGTKWVQGTLPGVPSGAYAWAATPSCAPDGRCLILAGGTYGTAGKALAWTWSPGHDVGRIAEVAAPPWHPAAPPRGIDPAQLSCPSAHWCYGTVSIYNPSTAAVSPVAWVLDGTKWASARPAAGVEVSDLSCAAPRSCAEADGSQAVAYDGTAWKAMGKVRATPVAGSYLFDAIDCPAVKDCTMVGAQDGADGIPVFARWNGASWTVSTAG